MLEWRWGGEGVGGDKIGQAAEGERVWERREGRGGGGRGQEWTSCWKWVCTAEC